MPPPTVKLSLHSSPKAPKSRSEPSSPAASHAAQSQPVSLSASQASLLGISKVSSRAQDHQQAIVINWDVLLADVQAFYQRWLKNVDFAWKNIKSYWPVRKRRGATVKAKTERKPRPWSRNAVWILLLTNAVLVLFGVARKAGWIQQKRIAQSMQETGSDGRARGVPRITPEDIARVMVEDEERYSVQVKKRHISTGHGIQGFIQFSSYRTESNSFAVLGLTPLSFHSMLRSNSCRWDDNGGVSMKGKLTVHFPGEAFRKQYETMILTCDLPHDIMSSRVATRERPIEALILGGNLTIDIDGDPVVVYREDSEKPLWQEPYKAWPKQLAMCTNPIGRPLHAERVAQWMHFHSNIQKVDLYMFYDAGGMDYDLGQALVEFWNRGMVEVVDIRDTNQYDSYHFSQVLMVNDCMYRTRFKAKWTLFLDFDQYLSIPPPLPPKVDPNSTTPIAFPPPAPDTIPASLGQSLLHFLDANKKEKWPFVTLGCYVFSVHHCTAAPDGSGSNEYAVERMVFRESEPYCRAGSKYTNKAKCQKSDGQRKYVINPRRGVVLQINRPVNADLGGYSAATYTARINWFRGLAEQERSICSFTWERGKSPDRLVEDDVVALLSVYSRRKQRLLQRP